MKKNILSISLILMTLSLYAQSFSEKIQIDFTDISQKLKTTKSEKTLGFGNLAKSDLVISLPLLGGESVNFKMVEYSIIPENTKTDIKTFYGEKVGDPSITCRLTLTKEKMMVSIQKNGETIIIERSKGSTSADDYEVFVQKVSSALCGNIEEQVKNGRVGEAKGISSYSYGTTLKIYRLALIVTNEFYADYVNDSGVNAEVVAIVNNLNGIYEKEVAVRLILAVPINPASSNFFHRKTETTATYYQSLSSVNAEINLRFGNVNFDVGHCIHNSGGGVAGLGIVCNSGSKGNGWSGSTTSSSVLLMAHELGHQFNAPHTFNGTVTGNCSVGNRSSSSAYEPGSGSTIMSYFGTCFSTGYDLSGSATGYFHTNSLENISAYIVNTSSNKGGTCGTSVSTGNVAPVANAGTAFTIPKNTPFKLIATGSDADGDVLTYTWEQYNNGAVSDTGRLGHTANGTGINAVNSTTAPLFRSKQSTSSQRYFPNLAFIMNNANNPVDIEGEDLSNVSRVLNFRVTVRDNRSGGGGANCSAVAVTVDATKGPLSVTSPNTAVTIPAGTNQTITWAVNSTNSLSANVKILLSIDGGNSFPFTLLTSTPNDGSQSVTIPSNVPNTNMARIIVASNNSTTAEFFDASDANFSISSTCVVKSSSICSESPLIAQEGQATLNLGLSSVVGNLVSNNVKLLSASPTTNRPLINYSDSSHTACQNSGSRISVLFTFRVSKTGNYVILAKGDNGAGFQPFSVFNSNTFDCASFVGSNSYKSIHWGYNKTLTLSECQTYYILVNPVFGPINISLSIDGVGQVYEVNSAPPLTSYTYVAINQMNGQITDVSAISNFTNTTAGTYKIYGLMYANGFSTNTLIGKTIEEAYGLGSCILFSYNSKTVTVLPNPCATTLNLTHPANDINSGEITKTASSAIGGKITASNWLSGAGTKLTYTARVIELNAGFQTSQGTVFKAEVGGCL